MATVASPPSTDRILTFVYFTWVLCFGSFSVYPFLCFELDLDFLFLLVLVCRSGMGFMSFGDYGLACVNLYLG